MYLELEPFLDRIGPHPVACSIVSAVLLKCMVENAKYLMHVLGVSVVTLDGEKR